MDIFNIESCEGTEELESSLKNQMIGSTMYDKRWVLNLIFQIASGSKSLESSKDLLSDLSSLAEMSVDSDVSEFLYSSGSLDILWSQIEESNDSPANEYIFLILVNCASNERVMDSLLSVDQYFLVPFLMIKCESASFLINVFRYLRLLLEKLLSLVEDDREDYSHRIDIIESLLSESSYNEQLRFILSSSSNNQLLLREGLFLLSLTELFCEISREDSVEAIFSNKDFITALFEALRQSMSKENRATMFVFIELIGHYINSENIEEIASDLCNSLFEVLESYVSDTNAFSSVDLDMIGTLLKIYSTSWNHVLHEPSYFALIKLSEKMDSSPCESNIALNENIKNCLNKFKDKFSS